MSGLLSHVCAAAVLFSLIAFPMGAEAQEDDEYRELVTEAVREHAAGRYAEARALFRQAHLRSPNARTLRGIGMTNFELRQYAATIAALEESLADTRRPLTDEQRAGALDLIERSNAFVARYTLTPAAALATATVDGVAAVVSQEGELLVDLGVHEIRVDCDGCASEPTRVRVVGGERAELDFRAATEPEADPDPEPEPDPIRMPEDDDRFGAATIGLLIGGGVAGVGAVVSGLWWRDRNSELDACDARPDCLNRDRLETERNATVGVALGLSVAAVGLLTAGVLTIGGDDDDERALRCVPAGMGMACAGVF